VTGTGNVATGAVAVGTDGVVVAVPVVVVPVVVVPVAVVVVVLAVVVAGCGLAKRTAVKALPLATGDACSTPARASAVPANEIVSPAVSAALNRTLRFPCIGQSLPYLHERSCRATHCRRRFTHRE
jgi:hypothetical protein